ncbi:MAG: hypothetical protein GX585_01535, partial [Clostridiales bacterium]|nr:hypothetical protein [Clostridiales bacterium]
MSQPNERENTQLQHEADHTKPKKQMSVVGYLALLFAAAFLLLLLSYLMQQRSNEAMFSELQRSISAVQSLDQLVAENKELEDRVMALEAELAALRLTEQSARTLSERREKALEAMDWLREIAGLYELGYYRKARTALAAFEESGLPAYLPDY